MNQGEKIAFKMESHNHPSFLQSFHGAATGVGGILRDVFTMGARPIALANFLCFGKAQDKKTPQLLKGVVKGISFYGNCIGIPCLTGRTQFHSSYNKNILVNAFALGILGPKDKVASSVPYKVNNLVVYVGAKTGRDGVHGAAMASKSFSKKVKHSTVQVGDPFYGKLLMESCLEAIQKNLVEAIQDMGAAGLTSSSFEMASKGNLGLSLNLDKVPLRDPSMTAEDILLSESQERMLLICKKENYEKIKKIFQKNLLECEILGETFKKRELHIYFKNKKALSIDPDLLTEKSPQLKHPYKITKAKRGAVPKILKSQASQLLKKSLQTANATSKNFVFEQYDQNIGAKTIKDCRFPIGVLKLPFSKRALGISLGGKSEILSLDAYEGAKDAMLSSSLNLALRGFSVEAFTNCLNFGNPTQKKVMGDFVSSISALKKVSFALKAPIISGNVSFYNQSLSQNITATPAICAVGIKKNFKLYSGLCF